MTQHTWLAGKLVSNDEHIPRSRAVRTAAEIDDASVRFEKMLREEVQLPHQLVAIEGDLIRDEVRSTAAPRPLTCIRNTSSTACLYSASCSARLRHAEVRLEGHVAEIFENQDPEIVGVPGDGWNRQGNTGEQLADIHEGQIGRM